MYSGVIVLTWLCPTWSFMLQAVISLGNQTVGIYIIRTILSCTGDWHQMDPFTSDASVLCLCVEGGGWGGVHACTYFCMHIGILNQSYNTTDPFTSDASAQFSLCICMQVCVCMSVCVYVCACMRVVYSLINMEFKVRHLISSLYFESIFFYTSLSKWRKHALRRP